MSNCNLIVCSFKYNEKQKQQKMASNGWLKLQQHPQRSQPNLQISRLIVLLPVLLQLCTLVKFAECISRFRNATSSSSSPSLLSSAEILLASAPSSVSGSWSRPVLRANNYIASQHRPVSNADGQYSSSSSQISSTQIIYNCKEILKAMSRTYPCQCQRDKRTHEIEINCDGITFAGQFPIFPSKAPIHVYRHRYAGISHLESQLFTASDIPLRRLDLRNNLLRRLVEHAFDGIQDTLIELDLSHNQLGDQLNPIFSSNELASLVSLRTLDLSANLFRAFDSSIFRHLTNLTELNLASNLLDQIPTAALAYAVKLERLNLGSNQIHQLNANDFQSRSSSYLLNLKHLNLSQNLITAIATDTFSSLTQLQTLNLAGNQLTQMPASTLPKLTALHLSDNQLSSLPISQLQDMPNLLELHLDSNHLTSIDELDMASVHLPNLEYLDLNRNLITSFTGQAAQMFVGLSHLRHLNLAYNCFRDLNEINELLFEPLSNLQVLDLTDTRLKSFPDRLLSKVSSLRKLFLAYNRIQSLDDDSLHSVVNLEEISLAYNLITHLPDQLFDFSPRLQLLNLHGNKITGTSENLFKPIRESLLALDLGSNDLTQLPKLDLPKLLILNLDGNRFETEFSNDSLSDYGDELPNVNHNSLDALSRLSASIHHVNLSYNHISWLSHSLLDIFGDHMTQLDLSHNQIEHLDPIVFYNLSVTNLNLNGNLIKELQTATFDAMRFLKTVDLSNNQLITIRNGAFKSIPVCQDLNLAGNRLTSFRSDLFSTSTSITRLNLAHNSIAYLYPNSFKVHRKLREINLSDNKLSYFPSEILNSITSLIEINLSNNRLQILQDDDFAGMSNLVRISLAGNEINRLGSNLFRNSLRLVNIDLHRNRIDQLSSETFTGLRRVRLNLSQNRLNHLPDDIFARNHVYILQSIDLSENNFTRIPINALRRQYSVLERLNMARNRIEQIPANSDLLVNVKDIDLSANPLSSDALRTLLAEPKSARRLNIAGTRLSDLPSVIEMPFLRHLNLSHNNVASIPTNAFKRSNLIHSLDLSANQLVTLRSHLQQSWIHLKQLQELYLSGNPLRRIEHDDFNELEHLQVLHLSSMKQVVNLDCQSLAPLRFLKSIRLSGLKSLTFFDLNECLSHLRSNLEELEIEIKEPILQSSLQSLLSSRIRRLALTGAKLTALSPHCLLGLRSPVVDLEIFNTSLTAIPLGNLLASLPMTTKLELSLMHNHISMVNSQIVSILESKQHRVALLGLETNALVCDCHLEPFRRWLIAKNESGLPSWPYRSTVTNAQALVCDRKPLHLHGTHLLQLKPNQLTCDDETERNVISDKHVNQPATSATSAISVRRLPASFSSSSSTTSVSASLPSSHFSSSASSSSSSSTSHASSTGNRFNRPEVIFQATPSKRPLANNIDRAYERRNNLTKIDTMIIGIVTGVVAFVCVLVMIICVIRLRIGCSETSTRNANGLNGSTAYQLPRHSISGMSCTCLKSNPAANSCLSCLHQPVTTLPIAYSQCGTMRAPRNQTQSALAYYGNNTMRRVSIKNSNGATAFPFR